MIEQVRARLLAARLEDLSDEKILRTVLDPLVKEFDELAPDEKTQAFTVCVRGILSWIDTLARHPDLLKTSELKPPHYVT